MAHHPSFSAISPDRNTEALTRWQTAPSDQVGFSAQWARPIAAAQLTAGVDGRFIHGESDEIIFTANASNVLTLANEELRAEHVHGGEAGLRYLRGRVMLSGTFFQENVDDPAGNITQSATATLITRQRQNIGALRARGADADAVLLLHRLQLRAGYEYVHSLVTSFSANPALVGKMVPQVPAHVFTLSGVYNAPRRWTVVALLRAASRQFDDDLNQFELQPYSVLGTSISKQTGLLTWFASAANIFDSKIQTAATPVLNYASPRIISGGVRVTVGR